MKTIRLFLIALFLGITQGIFGQEFIGSNARLIKVSETVIDNTLLSEDQRVNNTITAGDVCVIKLNSQTNEFNFSIPLYNILSASKSDSITLLNKSINANFKAVFPISDLDFFTSGSETSLQVEGELSVNGKILPATLTLSLQEALAQDYNNRDAHSYPVRVSFALEILPSDYNMDFETINFTRTITIEVRNGVVNRSNNN